jgi:pimeloyl-ACP methyl ester carboxylesterase
LIRSAGLALSPSVSEPTYPGAVEPERRRTFQSRGINLNALEWGDPGKPALLLTHGMWDHARGFAVLAPLLAEYFNVIALDQRGHGDSEWAGAYTWPADVRDIMNVVLALDRPVSLLGHSKGGGLMIDAACILPGRVRKVVNIDGFGPPPFPADHVAKSPQYLTEMLDNRRRAAQRADWRPYESLDQLIARRKAQNPRLTDEWLRFFCGHGSRRSEDGWRWKADPHGADGFGPWHPEWIALGYARLKIPLLAIVGSEPDTWGPLPEPVLTERLAHAQEVERRTVTGAGHFVHMERPVETASLINDFLRA